MTERFDEFATDITSIYKNIQKIKKREMTELDCNLKGIHVMCIFRLSHSESGLTVTELSRMCGEDKAAMSRTVSYLISRGYAVCDSERRYRAPITLTDAGCKIAAQINKRIDNAVVIGSDGLDDTERHYFYNALQKIDNNLKAYLEGEHR
ncbi:MAG: MarR family winged helix-turn-helix transcriptional regulator [Butyrivibrio sp.]